MRTAIVLRMRAEADRPGGRLVANPDHLLRTRAALALLREDIRDLEMRVRSFRIWLVVPPELWKT